ncbi:DUF5011 domain-containing protein [Candidatus Woesearchaeota archaeon]|nr:DUF5011 domain-containing protein [Candidatus Woesearchaeota archaeon]
MKTINLLFYGIFLIFLISSVSALTVYAGFDDGTQYKTLEYGTSINFEVDFFSMNPPMNLTVELRDSSDNLVYSFLNNKINNYEYNQFYTLNSSIYKNLGTYSIIAKGIDKINSQQYDELVVKIIDTTKPIINMVGDSVISITLGNTYVDAGATASDNVDGDITSKIIVTGSVDTNILGTYILHYNVKDNAGNSADEKTRTVNVVPVPDTTKPVITLLGDNPVSITLGNTYVDAGATASDNVDGDITSKIVVTGSVDTNILGTYILHYNVKDNAGNSADEKTRTVNVVPVPIPPIDNTTPTIEIISPINDTIYKEKVKFLNFIARDENLDRCQYSLDNGNTNTTISCISGVLNTVEINSTEGRNEIIIYAIDKSKNIGIKSVVFFVNSSIIDNIPPVITVFTPEPNKKYTSKSITFRLATDENSSVYFVLDDGDKIKMNNPYDHIFTYTLDLSDKSHKITFYATDNFGNTANKTIEFVVDYQKINKKDRTVETISLNSPLVSQENEFNTTSVNASAYQIGKNTIVLIPEKTTLKKNFFITFFENIINFFKRLFNIKY